MLRLSIRNHYIFYIGLLLMAGTHLFDIINETGNYAI
jgi:hypothetical protein